MKLEDKFLVEAYKHRYHASVGGLTFGFQELDKHLQFIQGVPMLFVGVPNMGKTNFLKECLINLSQIQGKKHFVFSPEGSGKQALIRELIEMHGGKPARVKQRIKVVGEKPNENPYSMTDEQWKASAEFVKQYFCIVERSEFPNPKAVTLQDVYTYADFCGDFDTITIDAFNQLHDPKQLPVHEFVNEIGHAIKHHDQTNKQSTFMVVHGQETAHITPKGGAPYPQPVATNALQGGKNWEKFADVIVQVYIPQKDSYESEYEYTSLILIQKMREKDGGKKGVVEMGWCPHRMGRYYELIDGRKMYGGDYLKKQEPETEPHPETNYTGLTNFYETNENEPF